MAASIFNPKPSDYAGQFRLGGACAVIGLVLLIFGLGGSGGWISSLTVILGVSLLIGGGAVVLTAHRSRIRARKMRDD